VGFDPLGFVMVNGPQAQVAFQGAEGFFLKTRFPLLKSGFLPSLID
jgi:hypothetical protein